MNGEFLNTKEAAEALGLSPITLRKWRCLGKGPGYLRLNPRLIRYRRADLEAWLERGAVKVEG